MRRLHIHGASLLIIMAAAAVLRFWGSAWGLHDVTIETRPHPDEWTIYWLSRWFTQTGTLNPCPSAHQCFFDWGMGFLYLGYAAHLVLDPAFGLLAPSTFGSRADLLFVHIVLAGRILSAVLSTATVYVVYLAAREAFDRPAGLLAAATMAVAALPIQLAHFATPDSMVMLLVSLTLASLSRALTRTDGRCLVAAGVPAGLAFGTEYHMILLAVPILAAWALMSWRKPTPLIGAAVAMLVVYLALNAYDLVDLTSFLAASHHTLMIRTVNSAAQYQGRFDAYGPDWLYIVRYPLGYGVGALLAVWYVAGFIWAAAVHRRQQLVVLAWILPYGLLISVSSAKFLRYSEPLMPALAVLAGGCAAWAVRRPALIVRVAVVCGMIAAALYSVTYDAAYASLFTATDARVSATTWLKQHAAPSAQVEFEQLPNGLINLPYFVTEAGFRPCFAQFQPARAYGPARFVLTDGYALEEHPRFALQNVVTFRQALDNRWRFRIVAHFHPQPSFLGVTFSTAHSPHDWRYPTRDITIYERVGPGSGSKAACYNTLQAATNALYPHTKPANR